MITRSLSTGILRIDSAICARITWVFCVGHHSVSVCVAASYCAAAALGSIGFETIRLLTIRIDTTLCAWANAASAAALSPRW